MRARTLEEQVICQARANDGELRMKNTNYK